MYRISFFFVTSDISNYRSFIRAVPKPLKKNVLKRGRNPIFNSLRPSKNSVILNFNYQIITSIFYPHKLYVKSLFISGGRDCCLFKIKRNFISLKKKKKFHLVEGHKFNVSPDTVPRTYLVVQDYMQ